jgi:hypothetical protein
MTTDRHLERDLPDILGEIATGRYPDYIEDVLTTTARRRQRPAWTFPERWLPMAVVTRRPLFVPNVRWRTLGVLALLALLIAAVLAAYIGSQPARLPAPFGLAASGHVVYAAGGDIYTVDPVTGVATAVETGPDIDLAPVWSRDGTHVAFERKVKIEGNTDLGRLVVARSDGSGLVTVTPEPLAGLIDYSFSPDGREVLLSSGPESSRTLWIAKADGGGIRRLDVGMNVASPSYRPPDGAEILFLGSSDSLNGLYAVDVASGVVRTIVAPSDYQREIGGTTPWSPDGSRIAYLAWRYEPAEASRVHVVAADGTGDRILPMPPGATGEDRASWSNDGTRLVVTRFYSAPDGGAVFAAVPADGGGVGVETDHGLTDIEGCCAWHEWAPDDASILSTPVDSAGGPKPQVVWDPLTGVSRPAPWAARSLPAWQRVAR